MSAADLPPETMPFIVVVLEPGQERLAMTVNRMDPETTLDVLVSAADGVLRKILPDVSLAEFIAAAESNGERMSAPTPATRSIPRARRRRRPGR